MRLAWICLFVSVLVGTQTDVLAQGKRPLEHEDYDRWNSITGTTLSENGEWVMYSVRDGKDNSTLIIRNLNSKKQYSIKNAVGPAMGHDSKHVAYRIVPDRELVKKLKKEKKPESEIPKEKFELLSLDTGKTIAVADVQSYSFPRENGNWLAMKLKQPKKDQAAKESKSDVSEILEVTEEGLKRPVKTLEKKKNNAASKKEKKTEEKPGAVKATSEEKKDAAKKPNKKDKTDGTTLVVRNLKSGVENRFPLVTSYRFDERGAGLVFATSSKDNENEDGVWYFDLEKLVLKQIVAGRGSYRNLTFDKKGSQLAFLTDRDDYQSKDSSWSLYHWRKGQSTAKQIVSESDDGVPEGWWLSSTSGLMFAENGRFLFYYTRPKPEDVNAEEKEDDKEPTAKLDLWHWQDPQLQPQQLLQAQQERNRSYVAAYNLRTRKAVQLATNEIPDVAIDTRRDSELALGVSNMKYRKMISWDMPGYNDAYLVNLRTGKSELILERVRSRPQLSPGGKYVIWWDTETRNWFAGSTRQGGEQKNLTEKIEHPLFNELHDTPSEPRAYGIAGWLEGDRSVLVYDRYDIWKIDPAADSDPICVTESKGREGSVRFRQRQLDREARYIDTDNMFLSAFNESNKESGFYRRIPNEVTSDSEEDAQSALHKIVMLPESLGGLQKAKGSDRVVFTRSTFQRFPDLWATDTQFEKISRISNANPQQQEFHWGSVELTEWQADDGQTLQGLLYKPDDFDSSKKYPLMVYFYERNSDNLHRYYVPAAGRSIINFSFYVSRGYVIFVPDIPYKTGEPGPSAANAVLPGVQHVIDQGFIDEERVGMQGHSWGGYQTAYLVTQTDMFACAESGAPVSNMTSAYGGIRWGSGLSRMFQYERTQSRIGDTLWNAREKYIANSPLFFVDKINTPLLILHNDEDGAVPWYQGIELFVAMRRLEKPAWLLNYNGDPHWVMSRENRLDFAKRMQQFFDHYLKGDPMPVWMGEGIPAVDKGKEFGFEMMETEVKEEVATEEED